MRVSLPARSADPTQLCPPGFSEAAFARLKSPRHRGAFFDDDAARRQLGLLTVAGGQARLYWLLNLEGNVVQEARYLAYGDLASGPVADAFCEAAQGKRFEEACAIPLTEVAARLGSAPFGEDDMAPFGFLNDLQIKLKEARPGVKLLPKPLEKAHYTRKPLDDMTDQDKAWLPLGLAKKLEMADGALKTDVAARLNMPPETLEITGLHDDLVIVLRFHRPVAAEQMPTLLHFAEEVFRSRLHPDVVVTEADR